MLITVNTDGSFYPDTKQAGYAFWITCNNGRYKKWGKLKKCQTSTEAELMAIANALYFLRHHKDLKDVSKIIINTDCESIINIMKNAHRSRTPIMNKIKGTISKYIGRYEGKDSTYEIRHVEAHKGTETPRKYVNNWLDKHAKKGAKL
jgi:ribonuclease HI